MFAWVGLNLGLTLVGEEPNIVPDMLEDCKVDDLVVLLAIRFSLPNEELCYRVGLEEIPLLSSKKDVVCVKLP